MLLAAPLAKLGGSKKRRGGGPASCDCSRGSATAAILPGRVLDHIGFDVEDLAAFVKKIEAEGVTLDEPYHRVLGAGAAITYLTDPWGTRVELVQLGM